MKTDRPAAAGQEYRTAANGIRGGFAVRILAGHVCWMLGDNDWHEPLWRERAVPPDGRRFLLDTFDQYLLLPAREGLDLASLLTVHKLCEANAEHGARAITLMQAEIDRYDERVKQDERAVLAAPRLPGKGEIGGGHTRSYNITSGDRGTTAAYLLRRLKRDHPDIAAALGRGEYRSARAAAIAAGIITPPTNLERAQRAYNRLTPDEHAQFRRWLDTVTQAVVAPDAPR